MPADNFMVFLSDEMVETLARWWYEELQKSPTEIGVHVLPDLAWEDMKDHYPYKQAFRTVARKFIQSNSIGYNESSEQAIDTTVFGGSENR